MGLKVKQVNLDDLDFKVMTENQAEVSKEDLVKMDFKADLVCFNECIHFSPFVSFLYQVHRFLFYIQGKNWWNT